MADRKRGVNKKNPEAPVKQLYRNVELRSEEVAMYSPDLWVFGFRVKALTVVLFSAISVAWFRQVLASWRRSSQIPGGQFRWDKLCSPKIGCGSTRRKMRRRVRGS